MPEGDGVKKKRKTDLGGHRGHRERKKSNAEKDPEAEQRRKERKEARKLKKEKSKIDASTAERPAATTTTAAASTAAPKRRPPRKQKPASNDPPPPTSEEELNRIFENLLSNLGMPESQKKSMRMFPKENKWTLICQSGNLAKETKNKTPEQTIAALQEEFTTKSAEALRISLGAETMQWLKTFVKKKGLKLFFEKYTVVVAKPTKNEQDLELITECARCAKALLNSKIGLEGVINSKGAIDAIIASTDFVSDKMNAQILEVLAALCLVSAEAHNITFVALENKFEVLANRLSNKSAPSALIVASLTLLNASISGMPPQLGKEFRRQYGLDDRVAVLRKTSASEALETQLDIYEDWDAMEEEQLAMSEEEELINSFDQLVSHLKGFRAVSKALTEVLQHMALLSRDEAEADRTWLLLDAFIQVAANTPTSESNVERAKTLCKYLLASQTGEDPYDPEEVIEEKEQEIQSLKVKIAELEKNGGGGGGGAGGADPAEVTKLKDQVSSLEKQIEVLQSQPRGTSTGDAPTSNDGEDTQKLKDAIATLEKTVEELKNKPPQVVEKIVEKPVETVVYKDRVVEKIVEKVVYKDGAPPVAATGGPPPPPMAGAPVTGGPPPPPMAGAPVTGGPPPPPMAGAPVTGGPPPPPMATGGPPPPPMMGGGGGPPPPPPMGGPGGGPPPLPGGGPPPLPGGMPMNFMPKKPVIKPAVKMKGLMWSKLPDKKVVGTMWEKDINEGGIQIDSKELEELFAASMPKPKPTADGEGGSTGGAAKRPSKPKKVSILDMKRSQNLSIMMSRFGKTTNEQIKKAIQNLDESILTPDNVAALHQFAPDPDEFAMVKAYEGDPALLGKAEQFVLAVGAIKGLIPRLKALNIKAQYDNKKDCLDKEVAILAKAVKQVKTSPKLKKLLEVVLAIGNYVNGSTNRGGAYGFKSDSLVKIADVKSTDNTQTMMQYLAAFIEKKYPELFEVNKELDGLQDAVRESIQQSVGESQKLLSEVNQLKQIVEGAPASTIDPFKDKLGSFATTGIAEMEKVVKIAKSTETEFKELMKYWGEAPSMDNQKFFSNIHTFVTRLEKAKAANERRKRQAEKQKEAEKRKQERLKNQKANGGSGNIGGGAPGMLDNVIGDMKSGLAFGRLKKTNRGGPPRGGGGPPQAGAGVANEALAMFARLKKKRAINPALLK